MMNFRQRMGWIGVGLYLLASAAAFYYVFEINETYNKLALEHIQQHPKEPQEGTTWTHSLKANPGVQISSGKKEHATAIRRYFCSSQSSNPHTVHIIAGVFSSGGQQGRGKKRENAALRCSCTTSFQSCRTELIKDEAGFLY